MHQDAELQIPDKDMRLSLNDDHTMLKDSFEKLFEKESSIERVRAAEVKGFDAGLWQALAEMGTFSMRLPGDNGFGLFDAWLAMERAGAALASGPVVEAIVAARILAELSPDHPLLNKATMGETVLVFTPLLVAGQEEVLIQGANVAEGILYFDGKAMHIGRQMPQDTPPVDNHADQALARINPVANMLENAPLASGPAAKAAFQRAVEEWKLLGAAQLCGMARQSLNITAEYAQERQQFGRPIGSFQAIAHPLAESITDIEGAQMLCWKAIKALQSRNEHASALVAGAWWWAGDAARRAVKRCLHSMGGYGLSNEYDIQIFHRRVYATSLSFGDPADTLPEIAERLWGETDIAPPDAGDMPLDFSYGPEAEAFVTETKAALRELVTDEMRAKSHFSFDGHDWRLHKALGARKLLYPTWPESYGGRGLSSYVGATMYETWEGFEVSTHAQGVTNMVGHMVIKFGCDALKEDVLPKFAAGEATASLGFSEPASGTDVFAAKTKAVSDGNDWIINGQKMWTSGANFASHVLLLTRTDPDAAKHAGITMFLVPLDILGIDIHPIQTFQDESTNATFYSDVRIPDKYRLGEVNSGAMVMGAALSLEQGGGGFVPHHRCTVEAAIEWAKSTTRDGKPAIENPHIKERLAKAWTRLQVSDLLSRRANWALKETPADRAAGPMSKLFASEAFLTDAADLFELAAPGTLLRGKTPLGMIELHHRHSAGTTIYGGTSEAQRSLIAEKALGLPKSR